MSNNEISLQDYVAIDKCKKSLRDSVIIDDPIILNIANEFYQYQKNMFAQTLHEQSNGLI